MLILLIESDLLINELQIQTEHLSNVESRFRNAYLAAQVLKH